MVVILKNGDYKIQAKKKEGSPNNSSSIRVMEKVIRCYIFSKDFEIWQSKTFSGKGYQNQKTLIFGHLVRKVGMRLRDKQRSHQNTWQKTAELAVTMHRSDISTVYHFCTCKRSSVKEDEWFFGIFMCRWGVDQWQLHPSQTRGQTYYMSQVSPFGLNGWTL